MSSQVKFVVQKAPAGLPGAMSLLGVFPEREGALSVCNKPGTYYVAEVEEGREYPDGTLNVEVITIPRIGPKIVIDRDNDESVRLVPRFP